MNIYRPVYFTLKGELIVEDNDTVDKQLFQRCMFVKFLNRRSEKKIMYDSKLKMHFESDSLSSSVYEVETDNFYVTASGRLSKAADFIRRLNYRYDWIQIRVNNSGRITAVENIPELKMRWERLKKRVQKDYYGNVVTGHLRKLDKEFVTDNNILKSVCQYLFFGLLFPEIPLTHSDNWKNERKVEFSEYEGEDFIEQMHYAGKDKGMNHYRITGQTLESSRLELIKYDGYLWRKDEHISSWQVYMKIQYKRGKAVRTWTFRLDQYSNDHYGIY